MWIYEKPDNLVEWWSESVKKFGNNTLFWKKNEKGTLDSITYNEIGDRINNARAGLSQLGVGKGDSVAIIANNRPEWCVLSYATYGCGAKYVPMYEKELISTWKYILNDSAAKILFVSKPEIYEMVKDFVNEISTLEKIIIIDSTGDDSLQALESKGKENPVEPIVPGVEDIAILIYTSGTTGDPKGVLLSHGSCTYCSRGGYTIFPQLSEKDVALSILPWAHSYAFSGELNNWIQFGGSLGFMEDIATLADDLKLVRPTFLCCVPRVFNKIYDGIQAKMADAGGLKKKLFDKACIVAKKKIYLEEQGKSSIITSLKYGFYNKLVFSKIKEALGGRMKASLTASAVMNKEVGEFFYGMGIPTYDCYGLSETAPAISMNCPAASKLGSVGQVLEGQKVVVDQSVVEEGAKDGELVIYGPNIMKGYHNKPEETARVMTEDGGFRTGDRGRFDEDGFLYLTGRIKEQYKLENGKYVFPAAIEEDIKLLPNIANVMVYGDGKRFNVSLIYPDFEVLGKWAKKNNLSDNPEELMKNKDVTDMIEKEISESLSKKFGGYEIPKKFIFTTEDFTIENGMLTPTLKLKRRVVMEKYGEQILAMYD